MGIYPGIKVQQNHENAERSILGGVQFDTLVISYFYLTLFALFNSIFSIYWAWHLFESD